MTETSSTLSRTHAFIIGINKYESEEHKNLSGCVTDANSITQYLVQELHVPQEQILCLLDEQATRKGIIDGFRSHLIDNSNIKYSDPIVIYFAGHGAKVMAPEEWHSADRMCEMILPHDASWSDGREDFIKGIPATERKTFVHGIPDRTLGALIYKLYELKGDNITVILDSCHSGSGTRSTATIRYSSINVPPPPTLDDELNTSVAIETLAESQKSYGTKRRGVFVPTQGTHVLLAACSSNRKAQETQMTDPSDNTTVTVGLFTFHLLQVLRRCNLSKIGYSGLVHEVAESMKAYATQYRSQVDYQTPQCEGANQDRVLFRTEFALSRSTMRVLPGTRQGQYLIEAGSATGIVVGTEFTVHSANMIPGSASIPHFVAISVGSTEAVLSARDQGQIVEIPSDACVRVARFNNDTNSVRILADKASFGSVWQKVFDNLDSLPINIIWTQPEDICDIVLASSPKGATLQSRVAYSPVQGPSRALETIDGVNKLTEKLTAVVHFHFHLNRRNTKEPLRAKVGMELRELKRQSNSPWVVPIFVPKEDSVDLFKEGLAKGSMVRLKAEKEKSYGLKLTNDSEKGLFPYVLYYDLQDYSITSLYAPPARTTDAPLPPLGELAIGYGDNGEYLLQITIADNVSQELGFFVLFVSTQWVDGAHLIQGSPFEETREDKAKHPDEEVGVWDTMAISVLTWR